MKEWEILNKLPVEVVERLREFKRANGRAWRAKLRHLWNTGKDEGPLRYARNAIGPTDLDKIKL